MKSKFPNLAKALAVYDKYMIKHDGRYTKTMTAADAQRWFAARDRQILKVQSALYADTKQFNTRKDCGMVPLVKLRKLVSE